MGGQVDGCATGRAGDKHDSISSTETATRYDTQPSAWCVSSGASVLSKNMLLLVSRESTPPQNRQLNILITNSEHQVDGLGGRVTFSNELRNAFCEIRLVRTPLR